MSVPMKSVLLRHLFASDLTHLVIRLARLILKFLNNVLVTTNEIRK